MRVKHGGYEYENALYNIKSTLSPETALQLLHLFIWFITLQKHANFVLFKCEFLLKKKLIYILENIIGSTNVSILTLINEHPS